MKNKHKILLGIFIVIIASSGFVFRGNITGHFVNNDFEEPDFDELPNTDNRRFTASVSVQDIGNDEFALYQKYQVGTDEECIKECKLSCALDDLEYYRAYVVTYGECMCKCLLD